MATSPGKYVERLIAMDFEEMTRRRKAVIAAADDIMRRDMRTRMLIDSSVVEARAEMGRHIDPEHADEEAHRIARRACAILAARIFTEDAELNALRAERDHYKKLAEEALCLSPGRPLILPAQMIAEATGTTL